MLIHSQFENSLSDEMCDHFMNKRIPEFWKTWNANFKKNISKKININGHINDVDIINEYQHILNVFLPALVTMWLIANFYVNGMITLLMMCSLVLNVLIRLLLNLLVNV